MMKRTINKILSATLAAVIALSPVSGMFGTSIEAHAATANDTLTNILTLDEVSYVIENNGNIIINTVKEPVDGTIYELDYNVIKEGIDTQGTGVILGANFFNTVSGIVIGEGIDFEKPAQSNKTTYIEFKGNNKLSNSTSLSNLFTGWTSLKQVVGFGNVVKGITSGTEVELLATFSGCTSLKAVDIDLTSYAGKIKLSDTFNGCTSLNELIITEANITRVSNITGDTGFADNANVQFLSCKFPTASASDTPLQYALKGFNGTVRFSNCTTGEDEGFALKYLVQNTNKDNTGSLTVTAENSNIEKIDNLISGTSYYDIVNLNGLVTSDTSYLKSIFGYHTKCNTVNGINGWDPSGLKEMYWPFMGIDLGTEENEQDVVSTLLSKDITGCTKYNTIGQTYNCEYSDLGNVRLSQDANAVYTEGSRSIYIPDYFVTASQFGGTYILCHEAWEQIGSGDSATFNQVVADEENVPVTENYGSNFNGFKYNNGTLKASTKYTSARVSLTVVNVADSTTRIQYYGNNTKVIGCSFIDADTQYYTDEDCTIPYDLETGVLTVGNDLTLYYGKVAADETTTTKVVTINWVDDGSESERPDSITVEWEAKAEDDSTKTGSVTVAKDSTVDSQQATLEIPKKIGESNVVETTIGIAPIEGYSCKGNEDCSVFTITKNEPVEADYSIISKLPTGWSAEFVGDVTQITATLDDGTKRKLGQDGDVIKFVGTGLDTPSAYNQPTEFSSYRSRYFFDVNIVIENGENTYNVKSIDGSMRVGVYKWLSDLDNYKWMMWLYPESINKTPIQVPAILSPNDTNGNTAIMTTSNCGTYVLLYDGAWSPVNTKTYTIEVNWDDKGNELQRPMSISGKWTSDEESDTFKIDRNTSEYVQTIYVEVPDTAKNVEFTLDDVPNYTVSNTSNTTYSKRYTLKYNPSNPTEPTDPIVENVPEGVSVTFGKDIEEITATLKDGTTIPLGSDNTSLIINVVPKNQTVYQSPKNQIFDKILFYDINLVVTDGVNEWSVKSIDTPMGVAIPIPTDCGETKDIKVWHYENGIMLEPTEVTNKSVTNSHIVIPTTSYSYYAVSYNLGDTEQRMLTLNWNDVGYESERPTSVVADWTATYANGTTLTGTVIFNKDTTVANQAQIFEVAKMNNGSGLVSVTATVRTTAGYSIVATNDPLVFEMKYVGNQANVINTTFSFVFQNDTAEVRPKSVDFEVTAIYDDGSEDNRTVTCDIASNGKGTVRVSFPIQNADGSSYNMITWDYPVVPGYERVSSGQTATYNYIGGGAAVQTEYPVTVSFAGDSNNTDKRPTNLSINWTAKTVATQQTTTGTFSVPINTTTNTFTQTVTIPAPGNEARTITLNAPVIEGYTVDVNGFNIVYTYESTASKTQSMNYEIIFQDEKNKAGRRPSELTVTLKDNNNSNNTITSTLKITDPTTATKDSYLGTFTVPYGTTYVIDSIKGLPEGYKESISGLSATLKYTPETVDKTYTVKWEGDAAELRPSTLSLKVKSGENEGATLTVSSSTNWTAQTKLDKYIKGVEANWTVEAPSVTNYSASVSGDTITYKYTGTLTEAQKDAINATGGGDGTDAEDSMYSFEKFDWIDYANRYPDVKKAFGYNKEALYAHYIHYGIAEGRVATFTGKYENVDEEILKAYFPNDYKYKVEHLDSTDQMLEDMGMSTSGSSDNSNVTVDEDGNTVIKTENADGTTTETIIDKDGNVVSTKTYATGDMRSEALPALCMLIILIAVCLGAISFTEFRKHEKISKFVNSSIQS